VYGKEKHGILIKRNVMNLLFCHSTEGEIAIVIKKIVAVIKVENYDSPVKTEIYVDYSSMPFNITDDFSEICLKIDKGIITC
jgi:hypothetical protein